MTVGKAAFFGGFGGFKKNYQSYQNKNGARVKAKAFYIRWYQQKLILVKKSMLNELIKKYIFTSENRQLCGESRPFYKIKIKGFPHIKISKKWYG